ncbi:MAG: hypothetical protein JXA37_07065 [Chloroflexia bacterium]|nr:hypothetical protein [Chloroflexia bacterium]
MNRRRVVLMLGILLPFLLSIVTGVTAQNPDVGRPAHLEATAGRAGRPMGAPNGVAATWSFFGMDMYLSGIDRSDTEVDTLSTHAQTIGVKWSREELAWAMYHQSWGPGYYDGRIRTIYEDGFGIIAILLTTPTEYRKPECQDNPLCPPANPQDFANFAGQVVERYDGDGKNDAPGSPRIAAWEVWNEPDQAAVWPPAPDPVAYTQMLCAAYTAIKAADPTATVLMGGLTDWDTVGLNGFGDQVVANGGWNCFDVVSFHPFMLSIAPDKPGEYANMRYRAKMVVDWIQSNGGGKQAWATEYGWSTCSSGSDCVSEDVQANYLVRGTAMIAAAGFAHTDYFQLLHKTTGMPTPYKECSLLRDDWTPKPAYYAYSVMTDMLENSSYQGTGPLYNVSDTSADRYDYKFRRTNGAYVDVVWQVQGQANYQFPVEAGVTSVTVYSRDGSAQALTPVGGYVTVTLSESPRYIVRSSNVSYSYHVYLPLTHK